MTDFSLYLLAKPCYKEKRKKKLHLTKNKGETQSCQNRTEQNRTEQNRTEQNRTEQNRTVDNSLLNTIYSVIKRPLCLNVKDYA